jgi:hypothetical protein
MLATVKGIDAFGKRMRETVVVEPLRIQCQCGWHGKETDLIIEGGAKFCPECASGFIRWPA